MALAFLAVGCSATRVTLTARSGLEQELLVRSLERAVARVDVSGFTGGKRVAVELYALTKDQAFAKEFVTAQLEARGVTVVQDKGKADLWLKVFATVLGVDNGQTLFGAPALVVPVVNIGTPEIALFKWVRTRGHSEVEIFSYDPHTDQFIAATPPAEGRAKYDEFTVLILISFTVEDLKEHPDGSRP